MDAAAVANLAALAASTPSAAAVPSVGLGADDLAAARFSEMMNARAVEDAEANVEAKRAAAAQAVQKADTGNQANGEPEPRSAGEAILDGVRNLSSDFQATWQSVAHALDGNRVTMSDMLKLQLALVQMSVQYEMVGKAISKSTQNIDQLVKMQ